MARTQIYALFASNRHVPQKIRVFVDYLAQALGGETQGELQVASGKLQAQDLLAGGEGVSSNSVAKRP